MSGLEVDRPSPVPARPGPGRLQASMQTPHFRKEVTVPTTFTTPSQSTAVPGHPTPTSAPLTHLGPPSHQTAAGWFWEVVRADTGVRASALPSRPCSGQVSSSHPLWTPRRTECSLPWVTTGASMCQAQGWAPGILWGTKPGMISALLGPTVGRTAKPTADLMQITTHVTLSFPWR